MLAVPPQALLALQAATTVAAIWGVVRLARLRALSDDPRLLRLAWFFGLFAAASAGNALVTGLHLAAPDLLVPPPADAPLPPPGAPPPGGHPPAWLDAARHGLEIVALLAGVWAYAGRRKTERGDGPGPSGDTPPPALAIMLFGPLGAAGFLEAALALYLAARVAWNGWRRATRRAYLVAAGFLLLFATHAASWLLEPPGGPPPVVAPLLALLGMVVLALAVPRRA